MYLDHFGFDEPPFSITPDPKFVFLSEKHQESLAHLIYGITRGGGAGFVQLTGEVGTGKTTISRLLLEQIPDKTNVALILNPTITPIELLQAICKELKIKLTGIKGKLNLMIDKLNLYLLKSWSEGETTVIIIDEAQNLPLDTLEQLRLLTNLETDKDKLLQIVLIGQPELRSTMRRNDLRQLAQRVTARYHLMPLDESETHEYLIHRAKTAGSQWSLFSKSVASYIHKLTGGVPRLINTVADRALLAAFTSEQRQVSKQHVKIAAAEVLFDVPNPKTKSYAKLLVFIPLVLMSLMLLYAAYYYAKNGFPNLLGVDKSLNNQLVSSNSPVSIQEGFVPPSSDVSWESYFELWKTSSNKRWQKNECPPPLDVGMSCIRRQGSLKQIELLNHAVILELNDAQLVVLKGINDNKLQVLNQNRQFQWVKPNKILNDWYGTYFILWSMPADLLQSPSEESLNAWVLEMANTISQEVISISNLDEWIKQFQQTNGLLADGIIGPETQMALSLKAYIGPTLTK